MHVANSDVHPAEVHFKIKMELQHDSSVVFELN